MSRQWMLEGEFGQVLEPCPRMSVCTTRVHNWVTSEKHKKCYVKLLKHFTHDYYRTVRVIITLLVFWYSSRQDARRSVQKEQTASAHKVRCVHPYLTE